MNKTCGTCRWWKWPELDRDDKQFGRYGDCSQQQIGTTLRLKDSACTFNPSRHEPREEEDG
jgi:hypothetical protein